MNVEPHLGKAYNDRMFKIMCRYFCIMMDCKKIIWQWKGGEGFPNCCLKCFRITLTSIIELSYCSKLSWKFIKNGNKKNCKYGFFIFLLIALKVLKTKYLNLENFITYERGFKISNAFYKIRSFGRFNISGNFK